jgi:hypothetical protein
MGLVDWKEYHKKRQRELETFLKASKMAVSAVGPHKPEPAPAGQRGRGRPGHTTKGMVLLNLLRMHLKLSYRDMESFLRANPDMRDQLGLKTVPGRDTIHRHAQLLSEEYLKRLNDRLVERLKKTSYESASMPRVSRSKSTRDVGALPRTRNAATRTGGSSSMR